MPPAENTNAKPAAARSPRRRWVPLIKAFCGVALLAFLFHQAQESDAFGRLLSQPKNWWLLGTALVLSVASVLLSLVRWRLIVRAAGISIGLGEAIKVGSLGFALNFVGPGAVSGDLFKAIAVGRGRTGQKTAAFTTIMVDRAMGLLSMLSFATVSVLIFRARGGEMSPGVAVLCQTAAAVAAGGLIGVGCLFVPGLVNDQLEAVARKTPLVGGVLGDFVAAWSTYRRNKLKLAAAALLCPVIVFLFVASFYCVALGLPLESPPLLEHGFIVPIQLTAAALAPTPQGVGAREWVVDFFYQGLGVSEGQGTLIAFGHTLTLLAVGGLATIYYFANRARVAMPVATGDSHGG